MRPYTMASQSVAIIGVGLKSIGRHVAEEAIRLNRYKVVVLTRGERPELAASLRAVNPSARFVSEVVDFSSVDAIKSAFSKHEVDTVIVALGVSQDAVDTQNRLIEAALQVKAIRRFAPNGWAYDLERHPAATDMYTAKVTIPAKLRAAGLESTLFTTGFILNWFANGYSRPGAKREFSNGYFSANTWIVNSEKGTAVIPEPDRPVIVTRLEDMGQYAARAAALKQPWTEKTGQMIGDRKTWSEVVAIAEKVQGRKFEVTRRPISDWPIEGVTGGARVSAQIRHGFSAGIWGDWANNLGAALKEEGLDDFDEPITSVQSFYEEWEPVRRSSNL